MDVANIMPGDVIHIELRYSELLVPTDGTYEFVYPTVVGPRYFELTPNTAADHDQWIQSPYLHEGDESPSEFDITVKISTGIPIDEVKCPTHPVDVTWNDKSVATVSLASAKEAANDRDFILRYRLMGRQIQSGLILYEGDEENFFLLLTEPPERVELENILPREVVFIVDVSGSMNGFPLTVSKELLRSLITRLRPTDTFNVILFAGTSIAMAERSIPANAANIQKAIAVIDDQEGGGGTSLYSAMERALAMPHEENISRSFVLVSDGYIGAESAVFDLIRNNLNEANVFAFGIGSSVNRHPIVGVAKAGKGEPFIVTNKREADAEATKLREYIESPVLTGITVEYTGFEAYAIEPPSIPDLMAKRPLQIFGKWRGKAEGAITVRGISGEGEYTRTFNLDETLARDENRSLRYLWVRTRVAELSDFQTHGMNEEAIREVTSLGLTYELLTRYTSFVAVHEVVRNTEGEAADVRQPLPLPKGVSDLAVGEQHKGPKVSSLSMNAPTKKVPEPGLDILFLILGIGFALSVGWRQMAGRSRSHQ